MENLDKKRMLIGEILLKEGVINDKQLKDALKEQQATGRPLGDILVQKRIISEEDVAIRLSEQLKIPYVDLAFYSIENNILNLIPEKVARKFNVMPLFKIGDSLTVAMVDPLDIGVVDQLMQVAKCEIEPVFATSSNIHEAIDKYYGAGLKPFEQAIEDIKITHQEESLKRPAGRAAVAKFSSPDQAPIVKLVNSLIEDAVANDVSDIHIEPADNALFARYRIDGVLYDVTAPPRKFQEAIVSRIKIMANMDIAEKRLPQEGRIQMRVSGKEIDLRISTFPTIYGENLVIRILDRSNVLLEIGDLGFNPQHLTQFEQLITRPYGIILVTGPTGSGKTTTLYASLNKINSTDKNIITLEDPVEYRLERIRQSQIDVKSGLTFAKGLRSILRQDPDVIMVGEIRDLETAEIAIHAALTGHLVFATLHTNDAAGAIGRLVDMGIEPFLISSSLAGVLAQRLIRRICQNCKETYKAQEGVVKELKLDKDDLSRGKGCDKCRGTGYKGRTAIFELLIPNEQIKELIIEKASSDKIRKAAIAAKMQTLYEHGLLKVKSGLTTAEEVMRLTIEE
ncbi:MAG: type II secretion system protein GspE [Candidatus Omnitrophica bacterium CG11_big_fil_rev_8_21_14_0_20_42_13]|uniref:protein-secreting ATPase n=1 Tax=Candidatus Ghiorseimicrobium undicola TaxID=1974746 RepID=A0A2H0LYK3_9BACT|nr:MAG: type II secretion system protein GspE [Candidatus Omnitrophica bacterium CG11_big_fil_rev_8_21_14_0_20_42_13]